MKTIEYLTDLTQLSIYAPGIVSGIVLATVCALLSPFVVLKRYAFVGQGVSHCAFGGVGVAAVLGVSATSGTADGVLWYIIVTAFCLAAAIGMGLLRDEPGSGRVAISTDASIGIFLVGSMALGAILIVAAGGAASWESILFGSILTVMPIEAVVTVLVGIGVLVILWLVRRPLIFWAFDETAAPAFGAPALQMRLLMMTLLALAVVTAMKVVGVVLPTAMLVLPGATALSVTGAGRAGPSFRRALVASWITALVGLACGLVLSMELDFPMGASIVLALTAVFAIARGAALMQR